MKPGTETKTETGAGIGTDTGAPCAAAGGGGRSRNIVSGVGLAGREPDTGKLSGARIPLSSRLGLTACASAVNWFDVVVEVRLNDSNVTLGVLQCGGKVRKELDPGGVEKRSRPRGLRQGFRVTSAVEPNMCIDTP